MIAYNSGIFDKLSFRAGDRKINIETGEIVTKEVQLDDSIIDNPSIAIPGYDIVHFKANEKKQKVYFNNPKENTCYSLLILALEDGTVIWESDKMAPGEAFNRIELNQTLEKGIYKAVLNYKNYSLRDGAALNGSNIEMIIEVK